MWEKAFFDYECFLSLPSSSPALWITNKKKKSCLCFDTREMRNCVRIEKGDAQKIISSFCYWLSFCFWLRRWFLTGRSSFPSLQKYLLLYYVPLRRIKKEQKHIFRVLTIAQTSSFPIFHYKIYLFCYVWGLSTRTFTYLLWSLYRSII